MDLKLEVVPLYNYIFFIGPSTFTRLVFYQYERQRTFVSFDCSGGWTNFFFFQRFI
jgi:hypothetical protein